MTIDNLYPTSLFFFEIILLRCSLDVLFKMSKSDAEQVVLKKVQIKTSGYYKCEVSR